MWTSSRDGFNPRSREGSDHVNSRNRLQILNSFNPRSREGSDETPDIKTAQGKVSIHAPAKGATYEFCPDCGQRLVSIHAPAKGATM